MNVWDLLDEKNEPQEEKAKETKKEVAPDKTVVKKRKQKNQPETFISGKPQTFDEQIKENKNPAIQRIVDYLLTRDDIKVKLHDPNKSLTKMYAYVRSEAQKQAQNGCAMIDDDTVYGWAVHYYDEENIG